MMMLVRKEEEDEDQTMTRRLEASAFQAIVKPRWLASSTTRREEEGADEAKEEEELMWLGRWVLPMRRMTTQEDSDGDQGEEVGGAILDVALRVPVASEARLAQLRPCGCGSCRPSGGMRACCTQRAAAPPDDLSFAIRSEV